MAQKQTLGWGDRFLSLWYFPPGHFLHWVTPSAQDLDPNATVVSEVARISGTIVEKVKEKGTPSRQQAFVAGGVAVMATIIIVSIWLRKGR